MKVILKESLKKLGSVGEIKDVKDGYARNFLIPRGLALPATDSGMSQIKHEIEMLKGKKQAEAKRLDDFADKLGKASVNISVELGESGKMFGSVTKEAIAEAVARESGIEVDKHDVLLAEPLKEPGVYTVDVRMKSSKFPEDVVKTAKIKVWIMGKEAKSE
jgi:large subunit ribosomal protein L9